MNFNTYHTSRTHALNFQPYVFDSHFYCTLKNVNDRLETLLRGQKVIRRLIERRAYFGENPQKRTIISEKDGLQKWKLEKREGNGKPIKENPEKSKISSTSSLPNPLFLDLVQIRLMYTFLQLFSAAQSFCKITENCSQNTYKP